jgi:hypothetical protein
MMAHSQMNRGVLLSMIEHALENELPLPTDEQIADRFCFHSVEQSRTLLAELVDRGKIHIIREGGERVGIQLGKASGHTLPPIQILPRPHHPKAKPAPLERRALIAAAAEKIAARPAPTKSKMPERPEVETVEAQRGGHRNGHSRPVSVDQGPRPERPPSQAAEETIAPVDASPQPVEARQHVQPNTRIDRPLIRRMSCTTSIEVQNLVTARAAAEGVSVNQWLGKFVSEALTAPTAPTPEPIDLAQADVAVTVRSLCRRDRPPADVLALAMDALTPWLTPKRKPFITGAVVRAAAGQGIPLDEFVTHLIKLGLQRYLPPVAEAAE